MVVKCKLAVITTEFMVEYVESAFSRMQLECEYQIYIYETFRDIPNLYLRIPEDVDGVLTSGSFPARVIKLSFPNTQRIVMPFNTDDAAICQLFFRLLDENRFLDFERIYADVVEMFDIDLKTFLMHDFSTPLSITTNQIVWEKGLEELYEIEEQEYEKHLKLWNSGTIDLCVTRFSSIVGKLREQGVPVYFPFPSIGYMREICLALLREIEYQTLRDNVFAIIDVAAAKELGERTDFSLEYRLLALQAALMEFLGADAKDYFFGRNADGIQILTNRKSIEKLTKGCTSCGIQERLNGHINFQISVGYGIGRDLYQARANAKRALEESERSLPRVSFLVDEYGLSRELLTAFRQEKTENGEEWRKALSRLGQEDKKMTIPDYKIRRVLQIMKESKGEQITSKELADKLAITKRSANRILSAMREQGVLEIVKTRQTASKGRPEQIYQRTEDSRLYRR